MDKGKMNHHLLVTEPKRGVRGEVPCKEALSHHCAYPGREADLLRATTAGPFTDSVI